MHFVSSNFNLMHSNSIWNKLKNNNIVIDKNFNELILSLNKKNLNKFHCMHFILYIDNLNIHKSIKELEELIKATYRNKKKYFFLYFFHNFHKNNIQKKIFDEKFYKLKFNFTNTYLKYFDFSKNYYSERNRIYLKFPFEIEFLNHFIKEIKKNIIFLNKKPYKLIILDCDNTLWGGVLDEEGNEKIIYDGDGLGQIFKEFQLFLKAKKNEGFLLSISSKNNEKDVWNAMKKRKMVLQKKDFIVPKINWEDKSKNIRFTLNQLSLREKDCVFIDDNKLEISKVKYNLKNLNLINIFDPLSLSSKIYSNPRFFKHKVLKEDLNKYEQYNLKSKFDLSLEKSEHSLNFYKKLKQKVKFHSVNSSNFERALQLFNKTNQFNFSLNRYTDTSLKKLINKKNYQIKLFSFKDKFGDHGIIGAYILREETTQLKIIDFVISCRVLNRYLEDFIILKILKKKKNKNLLIVYKKDKVNKILIPLFLKKEQFKLLSKDKNLYYYNIEYINSLNDINKIFKN